MQVKYKIFPLTQENIFRVNSKIDQDIAELNKIAKVITNLKSAFQFVLFLNINLKS